MAWRLGPALFLGVAFLYFPWPAAAVIKALTPLELILDHSNVIVRATVDQFYPEKPALVLTVQEDLKGKADLRRLPVAVKVDRAAQNENYIPAILKRLAVSQEVILFVKERGKKATVFGFTNG